MAPPPVKSATISAVVTNYNYGQYLQQAIDSLLAQSYPLQQIIIVNDGSSDHSPQIIQKLVQKHAQITAIHQANQGVVAARNKGAAAVNSQYMFFLDADDYLDPDYVKIVLNQLIDQQHQDPTVVLAYTDQQVVDQSTGIVKSNPWNLPKLLYRNYLNVATIFPTAVFHQLGGFPNQLNQQHSFDDWGFWLAVANAGYRGTYIPQPLQYYRFHGQGRNVAAIQQRKSMEANLQALYPNLYRPLRHRLYLAIFQTASRLRNKLIPPPGI